MSNLIGLFSLSYFGSISTFVDATQYQKIVLSTDENFQKQTYHNRCIIGSANGSLNLIIPIKHKGIRSMELMEISYEEDWQKVHLKSLCSAYRSSPFFEFYEDRIAALYISKPKYLKDFLIESTILVHNLLHSTIDISNQKEVKEEGIIDLRQKYHPKKRSQFVVKSYYQVFSEKMDFINDLCVLDLIFNLGPESKSYLESQFNLSPNFNTINPL